MKCNLLFFSILLPFLLNSQVLEYSLISIDKQDLPPSEMNRFGLSLDHSTEYFDDKTVLLVNDYDISQLEDAGIDFQVIQSDYSNFIQKKRERLDLNREANACIDLLEESGYSTPRTYSYGTMGGFHTFQELVLEIDNLANRYPNFVKPKKQIGNILTYEGRKIYYFRLSDYSSNRNKKKMLITGLHHAREPISMEQIFYFVHFLLDNRSNPKINFLLKNVEFYFVPCVNPDGYVYNQSIAPKGGGLHRKNRNPNNSNNPGVDLNRNYGMFWGWNDTGSSPVKSSDSYRGTGPFSEPETQAIRKLCLDNEFTTALNYHAWGDVLIYPWSYSESEVTVDNTKLSELGTEVTNETKLAHGRGVETIYYTANGDSDDWMYGDQDSKEKIWAFTPEIGNKFDDFWPSKSRIIPLCQEASLMNLKLALTMFNEVRMEPISPGQVFNQNFKQKIRFNNVGLYEGSGILEFRDLGGNIRSLPSNTLIDISNGSYSELDFDFSLKSNVQVGDEILIEVKLENNIIERDTIKKIYMPLSSRVDLFDNNFSSVNRSSRLSTWSFVDFNCYSSPDCFTDSQYGNYDANSTSEFVLDGPINLPNNYDLLELNYMVKWDLTRKFQALDYAQIKVSTDGRNFYPLCTEHTIPSTLPSNLGEPIYTGTQETWIHEKIDLSDYAGDNIWIKFVLQSNSQETSDGLYIDDLYLIRQNYVGTDDIVDLKEYGKLYPNPTTDGFNLTFKPTVLSQIASVSINSVTGQNIMTFNKNQLSESNFISTAELSPGMYFVHLYLESGEQAIRKVLVE